MTEPKSWGQVAYEGYAGHTGWKSLMSGDALPLWHELRPAIREAWEASSLAVFDAIDSERDEPYDG